MPILKQMVATLSITGEPTSVALVSERFAKVFVDLDVKPEVISHRWSVEYRFAAAALDFEPIWRGWRQAPRPVAEFAVLGEYRDEHGNPISVRLQETESASDNYSMFPYDRAAAIGASLKAAVDELHKAGKLLLRHEKTKGELAVEAARVERGDTHGAMLAKYFAQHAGPQEQFALLQLYEAFYDRHQHQRKAG